MINLFWNYSNTTEVAKGCFYFCCRWLLALGSHRLSHPEWQASSSGCPAWAILSGRLCWNLSLSGALKSSFALLYSYIVWSKQFRQIEFLIIALCCSSGSSANGSTSWWMTDCLSKTGSWCSSTLLRAMNSGVHSWKRLMRSRFWKSMRDC